MPVDSSPIEKSALVLVRVIRHAVDIEIAGALVADLDDGIGRGAVSREIELGDLAAEGTARDVDLSEEAFVVTENHRAVLEQRAAVDVDPAPDVVAFVVRAIADDQLTGSSPPLAGGIGETAQP